MIDEKKDELMVRQTSFSDVKTSSSREKSSTFEAETTQLNANNE